MNLSEKATKNVFKVFPKDCDLSQVLEMFYNIKKSGLSEIMNNKGIIETYLNKIYWDVISQRINTWIQYAKHSDKTKDALLRLILNHLIEEIDNTAEHYLPDEVYLTIIENSTIKTGQLYVNNATKDKFIIISPACDLTLHGNCPKSDFIQICKIDCIGDTKLNKTCENFVISLPNKNEEDFEKIKSLKDNAKFFVNNTVKNKCFYMHYLPKADIFPGGIINFREVISSPYSDFINNFTSIKIQISAPFLKDIIARFSSYYARQGQPTFNTFGKTDVDLLRK